jgi:D-glycero-D-manno-heptose 1,7-bisphosphate phosphatase
MLREAMAKHGAAPADTVTIGDSLSDLQAAAAAGCRRILVRSGKGRATQAQGLPHDIMPVAVFEDLAAAVDHLLGGAIA